jgi:hypothetical protein
MPPGASEKQRTEGKIELYRRVELSKWGEHPIYLRKRMYFRGRQREAKRKIVETLTTPDVALYTV